MSEGHYDDVVERLAAIEEELRDRAYDRLRDAAEAGGDDDAQRDEKRLNQARRAIAKAIQALDGGASDLD